MRTQMFPSSMRALSSTTPSPSRATAWLAARAAARGGASASSVRLGRKRTSRRASSPPTTRYPARARGSQSIASTLSSAWAHSRASPPLPPPLAPHLRPTGNTPQPPAPSTRAAHRRPCRSPPLCDAFPTASPPGRAPKSYRHRSCTLGHRPAKCERPRPPDSTPRLASPARRRLGRRPSVVRVCTWPRRGLRRAARERTGSCC
mmetsp:Transcript_41006/g.94960  ORF Transcript_41006/g.94960 Transcript_41006/m.94960 type:complete len:204 (-) Transcript_41006:554-1165(-)